MVLDFGFNFSYLFGIWSLEFGIYYFAKVTTIPSSCPQSWIKSVFHVIDAGFFFIEYDGDDVETNLQGDVLFIDISVRRTDKRLLLVARHGILRLSKRIAASRFHLHNNKKFLIPRHEVYLIASRPPVDVQDDVSQLQEVPGGDLFALLSEF